MLSDFGCAVAVAVAIAVAIAVAYLGSRVTHHH
jgi:hypothetical protein